MGNAGANIRKFRELAGLSQKEFAKMIGSTNVGVSHWELGVNRPDIDTLVKICEVLNVSSDEILEVRLLPSIPENKNPPPSSEEDERETEIPPDEHTDFWIVSKRLSIALDVREVPVDILAEHIKVPTQNLLDILDKKVVPSISQMQLIANSLRVKLTYLLGYPVRMKRNYYTLEGTRITGTEAGIYELFEVVPKDDQLSIIKIILSFLKG